VILPGQPDMAGRSFATVEELHDGPRDKDVDVLADQFMRHGVEIPFDRNVIIDVDGRGDRPLAEHVGFGRQGLEGGALDRFEQVAPAAFARRRHRLVVELGQQRRNRLVQLGQREELPMPQRCQQPTAGRKTLFSTPGLSRGLRDRAGTTAVP
jgi:hypothetical protein